jgi:hypothetical protein
MAAIHNPKHRYDCGNCKFNWNCGYTCSCALKHAPEEPKWLKKQLQSIQKIMNENFELKRETNVPNERQYNQELPDYVDLMTTEDWLSAVDDGCFCDFDGSGYWVKDGKECRDEVFSTPQLDATHVAWYNK